MNVKRQRHIRPAHFLFGNNSKPIWFVGVLVFVSVFGWMFRFRGTETELILRYKDENAAQEFQNRLGVVPSAETVQQQRRNEVEDFPSGGESKIAHDKPDSEVEPVDSEEVIRNTVNVYEIVANNKAERKNVDNKDPADTTGISGRENASTDTEVDVKTRDAGNNDKDESSKEKDEKNDNGKTQKSETDDSKKDNQGNEEAEEDDSKLDVMNADRRPVYFLNQTQLEERDAFSASWLQTTEDFLSMDLDKIGICEDAAFKAFRGPRRDKLRATVDWLDFSLEHLSKWWKILQIFDDKVVYEAAIHKFEKYIANGKSYPVEKKPAFKHTIAVIAFQAYKDKKKHEQAFNLTVMSLGATIDSLRRAGFGRVVVVGNGEKDRKAFMETFRYLKENVDGKKMAENVTEVGHMELGFAEFKFEDAKTRWIAKNIPRGALFGLRDAFRFAQKRESDRPKDETDAINTWLGDNHDLSYWRYVYLTEPDSVLQTRPSTLTRLKEEVDKGMVLVPHRLQPIPHESDVRSASRDWLFVPEQGDFGTVMELDAIGQGDVCCDEYKGPNVKPGLPPNFGNCGNFWYMCDFSRRKRNGDKTKHERLKPYALIRLKQGTEIVSLASLEWGRRCLPQKNAVCKPPHIPPYDSPFLETTTNR